MIQTAAALMFIWAGFILSISFFESWVKFRAQGVTLPVALSIGKLVFTALNRIEWAFAIIIAVLFLRSTDSGSLYVSAFIAVIFILLIQTLWLLPALNARAKKCIKGERITSSKHHLYFITAEIIKLSLLFYCGNHLLKMI